MDCFYFNLFIIFIRLALRPTYSLQFVHFIVNRHTQKLIIQRTTFSRNIKPNRFSFCLLYSINWLSLALSSYPSWSFEMHFWVSYVNRFELMCGCPKCNKNEKRKSFGFCFVLRRAYYVADNALFVASIFELYRLLTDCFHTLFSCCSNDKIITETNNDIVAQLSHQLWAL